MLRQETDNRPKFEQNEKFYPNDINNYESGS